jgi:hypothetical protein
VTQLRGALRVRQFSGSLPLPAGGSYVWHSRGGMPFRDQIVVAIQRYFISAGRKADDEMNGMSRV